MDKAANINESFTVPCVYPVPVRDIPLQIQVPGSKSITNRALLLATLGNGTSTLRGALFSDDSRVFLSCIQRLGFPTKVGEEHREIQVTGMNGRVPVSEADIYVGSAGTAARFLTAYLGISHGIYHMDASEQMRRRPMAPLLDSLNKLGCDITFGEQEGFFPFTLRGHEFGADTIAVNIEHSSQFLSALLISAALAGHQVSIQVEGSHGMAYIQMTVRMMEQFGVAVSRPADDLFIIDGGQSYHARDYRIEPDVSAACYFYAMALLLKVPVMVENVFPSSLQGDIRFLQILEQMGCRQEATETGILLMPPKSEYFPGVDVNMFSCSDQAITLAAMAPFADSPTTIRGIGHIRYQESDRIHAIVTELRKMGIQCHETDDSITIFPGNPLPAEIDTYEDHRMAMGFALTGLRAPGIIIRDPGCCRKTFDNYFEVLGLAIKALHHK